MIIRYIYRVVGLRERLRKLIRSYKLTKKTMQIKSFSKYISSHFEVISRLNV